MEGVYLLEASEEDKHANRVHQNVEQVGMEETSSQQSIDLPLFDEPALSSSELL